MHGMGMVLHLNQASGHAFYIINLQHLQYNDEYKNPTLQISYISNIRLWYIWLTITSLSPHYRRISTAQNAQKSTKGIPLQTCSACQRIITIINKEIVGIHALSLILRNKLIEKI